VSSHDRTQADLKCPVILDSDTTNSIKTMSGKGWWNSAISGLESRLDGMLAEEAAQGGAKPKTADAAGTADVIEKTAAEKKLAVEPGGLSPAKCRRRARLTA
jgi:hypothetical protein